MRTGRFSPLLAAGAAVMALALPSRAATDPPQSAPAPPPGPGARTVPGSLPVPGAWLGYAPGGGDAPTGPGIAQRPAAADTGGTAGASVTGAWVLNTKLSDDPTAALRPEGEAGGDGTSSADGGKRRGRFRAGFGGGRGGDFDGSGRGSRLDDEDETSVAVARARKGALERGRQMLRQTASTLVIRERDGTFQIGFGAMRASRWPTDGEPHPDERLGSGVTTKSSWDGRTLAGDSDLGGGVSYHQTFAPAPGAEGGPRRLAATSRVRNDQTGETLVVRRVYDEVP
jgi:hypothetical protein